MKVYLRKGERELSGTKYGKYFITLEPKEPKPKESIFNVILFDGKTVPGSNFYHVHWMLPWGEFPKGAPASPIGHPPHMHKDPEILMFIGTDPNNPMDLGAECEFFMGPEQERHVINKTCAVYIPANLVHGPFRTLKTVRPWIMIRIFQGPVHTEKYVPEVLPPEVRDKVDWSAWKRMEEGY
ncbi:MAG: hypothetical protein QXT10_05260 [Candidatus Bathyarchaeia archaeon]